MAFGTPIYMAPEQALGNKMDGRADLYAAAVMGYEMLCGQPPFYSDDKLEVMSMHTAKPVPPMRQRLVKGGRPIPSSIERLIVRGLTKKPGDRYATAEEFLAEVEHALRTPDGGVTDVVFERVSDTGAQPLITADGESRITGETDFAAGGETMVDARASIADAINDALNTPMPPMPALSSLPGLPPARDARGSARAFDAGDAVDTNVLDGPELPTLPKLRKLPDDDRPLGPLGPLGPHGPPDPSTPRGGVGLGLPYTGPHGVQMFGMTPEQRLASASTAFAAAKDSGVASALEPDPRPPTVVPQLRKRLGLYVVIGMCAIAIGVIGAVITANANRGAPALDPSTPAGAAAEALAHGDPARALQILDANQKTIGGDANAQLVLGHVRAARNESEQALAAYDRALGLNPELEADDKLRAALRTMAGSPQDYDVVARAFDLWVGRTRDAEARKLLLVSAVHDDLARRKAVRPVIERRKLGGNVDWLKVYSLDLQQEPTCDARREAVANLRALGDVRAVGALERAMVKTSKSTASRGRKVNVNDCLSEDASAAIGYLRGLSRK
jgi:tetratricopeptide (TPR) repeat protein